MWEAAEIELTERQREILRGVVEAYVAALARETRPAREVEALPGDVKARERVMLGLRLDEPLPLAGVAGALDRGGLDRLERLGLVQRCVEEGGETLTLTRRGRFLGDGAAAVVLA